MNKYYGIFVLPQALNPKPPHTPHTSHTHTILRSLLASPSGEIHFRKAHPPKQKTVVLMEYIYICIYIYIYIYVYGIVFVSIDSRSFSGFCFIWAVGGGNIGQKCRGRLTKILPARQTHFGDFFGQPFGENTFSTNAPPKKSVSLIEKL